MKNSILYILAAPHSENSYWWTNIKRGIVKAAFENKYDPVYITTDKIHNDSNLRGSMVLVVGHHTAWIDENIEKLLDIKAIPVLANTSMFPGHRRSCSGIVLGLEDAMREAIAYLKRCGRKKIAFLGANPDSISDKIKCEIFGIPEDIISGQNGIESCVERFAANFKSLSYDAALCANDTVAICLMQRMEELGYSVPDELFIIGMGNSFVGRGLDIPLATIDFNYYEMGMQAVNLFRLIENSKSKYNLILTLQSRLIIRESAACGDDGLGQAFSFSSNHVKHTPTNYFEGEKIRNILSVESFLQSCDPLDGQILTGVMRGLPIKTISEETYLGERAVRYRIKNIIEQKGFSDKKQLISYLKTAIVYSKYK